MWVIANLVCYSKQVTLLNKCNNNKIVLFISIYIYYSQEVIVAQWFCLIIVFERVLNF